MRTLLPRLLLCFLFCAGFPFSAQAEDWFSSLPFKTAYIEYQENHPSLLYPPSLSDALAVGVHDTRHVQKIYIDAKAKRLAVIISRGTTEGETAKQIYENGTWYTFAPEYYQGTVKENDQAIISSPRIFDTLYLNKACQKSLHPSKTMLEVETEECSSRNGTYYFWHQMLLQHVPTADARAGITHAGQFYPEKYQTATYLKLNEAIPDHVFSMPQTTGPDYGRIKKDIRNKAWRGGTLSRDPEYLKLALGLKATVDPFYAGVLSHYIAKGDKDWVEKELRQHSAKKLTALAKALGAPADALSSDGVKAAFFLEAQASSAAAQQLQQKVREQLAGDNPAAALPLMGELLRYNPANSRMHAFYGKLLMKQDQPQKALAAFDKELEFEDFPIRINDKLDALCAIEDFKSVQQNLLLIIAADEAKYKNREKEIQALLAQEPQLTKAQQEGLAAAENPEKGALASDYTRYASALLSANLIKEAVANYQKAVALFGPILFFDHPSTDEEADYQERIRISIRLALAELKGGLYRDVLETVEQTAKSAAEAKGGKTPTYEADTLHLLAFIASLKSGTGQELVESSSKWENVTTGYTREGYERFVQSINAVKQPGAAADQSLCQFKDQGVPHEFQRLAFFAELNDLNHTLSKLQSNSACLEGARAAVESTMQGIKKKEQFEFTCGHPLTGGKQ